MEGLDLTRDISLYIHVPFCHRKCDYCAFYSLGRNCISDNEINLYLRNLILSIDALNKEINKPYYTIFIGGGNPALIGYENLRKILMHAEANGMPEEVTIEINPEDVTDDILSLKDYVTRISIGVQSLKEKTLKTLGRNSSVEKARNALSILSTSGFDFNADLIVSVPGQSVEEVIEDINTIDSYNPTHISLYCLTFEEGTPIVERLIPIGEDKEVEFLTKAWKHLESLGYEHYEISNFAKKGKESKHNLVYWHLGQYIGLGPTAESSIGYERVISMRNTEDLSSYISDPAFEAYRLDSTEAQEEFLLASLRIKEGIDKRIYKERFNIDFDSLYLDAIKGLDPSDYINTSERFSLTEEGMLKLDNIILTLALHL